MTALTDHFRQAFPYFQRANAPVYLDSAATALKPQILIDSTNACYSQAGSVHRGMQHAHTTDQYEHARTLMAQWLHCQSPDCVVWTSGATASINLVAHGIAPQLCPSDNIITTRAEHHANFVPWVMLAQKCGAALRVIDFDHHYAIDQTALLAQLDHQTKLVALNLQSNITGTIQAISPLIHLIRTHAPNAYILLDCAQAIVHQRLDVQKLDADFYVFSAHKLYGPTGLGVLTGKRAALSQLQPLHFGGKMVQHVSERAVSFAPLPYRLEAGTPNIAAVIAFGDVLAWLATWDIERLQRDTVTLAQYCYTALSQMAGCRLFSASPVESLFSFAFDGIASIDLALLLQEHGIVLRTGQHCAQPYLHALGEQSLLRLSFAPYNNTDDIEQFLTTLSLSLDLLRD
ncbi:aminotransferase class V-fold PLP-dependent enzyme [Spirabiliibacterium falconis]|uniref:aminotransferase class V-fold PLP-dependent enzyme n=1 Tax=Spirabiliibacterium falconis TaxID=572023 RepID=UPI001AADE673|nr:cysteine desulfurase [Spirabiliibacterium falconis]MBE2894198.1 cysteine desulfurase [Spirabiliibacterium falconis]